MKPTTLAALLPLLLVACATAPTVVIRPDGTKLINLGTNIFEDSKTESALVDLPDGTKIAYYKTGKSQTKVPLSGIRTYGTIASIKELWAGQNEQVAIPERAATDRAAIKATTDQAKIQADVTKATFVPPETIAPAQ